MVERSSKGSCKEIYSRLTRSDCAFAEYGSAKATVKKITAVVADLLVKVTRRLDCTRDTLGSRTTGIGNALTVCFVTTPADSTVTGVGSVFGIPAG